MFTHPYIASQLSSERIARFQKEAAEDQALRQARAARRQSKADSERRKLRHAWFRRSAVPAPVSIPVS